MRSRPTRKRQPRGPAHPPHEDWALAEQLTTEFESGAHRAHGRRSFRGWLSSRHGLTPSRGLRLFHAFRAARDAGVTREQLAHVPPAKLYEVRHAITPDNRDEVLEDCRQLTHFDLRDKYVPPAEPPVEPRWEEDDEDADSQFDPELRPPLRLENLDARLPNDLDRARHRSVIETVSLMVSHLPTNVITAVIRAVVERVEHQALGLDLIADLATELEPFEQAELARLILTDERFAPQVLPDLAREIKEAVDVALRASPRRQS